VTQVSGDHDSLDDLVRVCDGADAVLHLSALQPTAASSEDVFGKNVQGTLNVFEAAARCGVQRVINWSSVWVLGWSSPGNRFVPDYLPIDEAHPLRATDPYGRSKIEGEAIAASFHGRDGLQAVTLRPVFTATRAMLETLWGTKGLRSPSYSHLAYVDARDQAVAARRALESHSESHLIVYLAADDSRVAEPLSEVLPRLHPEIGDRARQLTGSQSSISSRHAAASLGWKPEHSWRNLPITGRIRGVSKATVRRGIRTVLPRGLVKRVRGHPGR
jgi:nucleoside-diphosphate-sugar epimerase